METGGHRSTSVEEGRGPGADTVVWGSPGLHWKRQFPFLECIWEGGTTSLGTKELVGTTELLNSLAYTQRHLLRAANVDAGICWAIPSNPKALCIHAFIQFLGQTGTCQGAARHSPRGSVWVHTTPLHQWMSVCSTAPHSGALSHLHQIPFHTHIHTPHPQGSTGASALGRVYLRVTTSVACPPED